jgi:D-alanyl-D-alanine carboxypeptidase
MQNLQNLLKIIAQKLENSWHFILYTCLGALLVVLIFAASVLIQTARYADDSVMVTSQKQDLSLLLSREGLSKASPGGSGYIVGYFNGDQFVPVINHNQDATFPSASLIKMVTAGTVLREFPLDTKVQILPSDNSVASREYLRPYMTVTVHDLLESVLVTSSNSSVATLIRMANEQSIDLVGGSAQTIANWGLQQTSVGSLSGLDQLGQISFMSPRESVIIAHNIFTAAPWLAEATTHSQISLQSGNETVTLSNSNPDADKYNGLRFSKTGYTDIAGGNLVTLYESCGILWGTSVMGDTINGRFATTRQFLDAINNGCSGAQAVTAYLQQNRVQ